MDKSTLLLSAIVLAVFGTSVAAGRPSWGIFTGIAIILLAAGLAAGALPMRSDDYFDERAAGQRISKSLVTLSSTAIVAIYAAGYYRTSAAAHKFDSQGEQRKTVAAVIPAAPPAAENPPAPAAPAGSSPSAAPAAKKNVRKPAAGNRKTDSASTEPGESPASGSGANAATTAAASPQTNYKDGTFLGWGSCRHGDIEASVQIQDGKIVTATITQCLTRYSCSWISPRVPSPVLPDLPREVVERQSAKVDYVSGATESSYAFADAITAALSKASE